MEIDRSTALRGASPSKLDAQVRQASDEKALQESGEPRDFSSLPPSGFYSSPIKLLGATKPQGELPLPARVTPHFERFLEERYPDYDFVRADVKNGSFGGKVSPGDRPQRQPVLFIHGNSDSALGSEEDERFTGWRRSVEHFMANGYKSSELYGTTWGPADADEAFNQQHDQANIMQIRKHIEAVLAYTGSKKIDIVAHSMGVTLARKAILGGTYTDPKSGETFELGPPLTDSVDAFVGIEGANWGLTKAYWAHTRFPNKYPVSGDKGGFFPGYWTPAGVVGMSDILADINETKGYEGSHRFSIWSQDSKVGNLVWGRYTKRIPGQTGERAYRELSHFEAKDLTAEEQFRMVTEHRASTDDDR